MIRCWFSKIIAKDLRHEYAKLLARAGFTADDF